MQNKEELDLMTEFVNIGADSMFSSLVELGLINISDDKINGSKLDVSVTQSELSDCILKNTNEMIINLPAVQEFVEKSFDEIADQINKIGG